MYKHYDYKTKLQILSLYKEGYGCGYISNLLSLSESHVCRLLNRYRNSGEISLKRLNPSEFTVKLKTEVVHQVLEKSLSCEQVALQYGISESAVYSWVSKVKFHGYESLLAIKPKGRPCNPMGRPKKKEPQTETERLQEQVLRLQAENALLKKVKALVETRQAQQRKIGRKPSKN